MKPRSTPKAVSWRASNCTVPRTPMPKSGRVLIGAPLVTPQEELGAVALNAAPVAFTQVYPLFRLPPETCATTLPEILKHVSLPGRTKPAIPPTLQTFTYSAGADFRVGRSAACAAATATSPAAEPSKMLFTNVTVTSNDGLSPGVGFFAFRSKSASLLTRYRCRMSAPIPRSSRIVRFAPIIPNRCGNPPRGQESPVREMHNRRDALRHKPLNAQKRRESRFSRLTLYICHRAER